MRATKCYTCAKDGKSNDAVAVRAVCGMGLCKDHALEREIFLTQRRAG